MTVESVAKALKEISNLFACSDETAWKQYMHPAITVEFTFEEIKKHIEGEEGEG